LAGDHATDGVGLHWFGSVAHIPVASGDKAWTIHDPLPAEQTLHESENAAAGGMERSKAQHLDRISAMNAMTRSMLQAVTAWAVALALAPSALFAASPITIKQLTTAGGVSISGTVKSVVGNDFVLEDGTGEVIIDAGPRWYRPLNFSPGERLTVTGEYDDGEFDAFTIRRENGTLIEVRPASGPPPWEGGRRD
jgi:hypothetical protein